MRTGLIALPLRTVLRLVERAGARRARPRLAGDSSSDVHLRRMIWAVEIMGNRLFPKNPCLTQALVIQMLFRRAGRPAELRIGVRREADATPQAHAWVVSEGAIVIGQSEALRGYVSLPPLPLDG
jgi:hypothetical protein